MSSEHIKRSESILDQNKDKAQDAQAKEDDDEVQEEEKTLAVDLEKDEPAEVDE